jgi:hypothetical protein
MALFRKSPRPPPPPGLILASKSRTCGSHLPSNTCKMCGNGSQRGGGMAWVALWRAFLNTGKCSFLMISPKLLDISPFFLLIFSPLGTADFWYYLSFQVMAILCCVAKNSLCGTLPLLTVLPFNYFMWPSQCFLCCNRTEPEP